MCRVYLQRQNVMLAAGCLECNLQSRPLCPLVQLDLIVRTCSINNSLGGLEKVIDGDGEKEREREREREKVRMRESKKESHKGVIILMKSNKVG